MLKHTIYTVLAIAAAFCSCAADSRNASPEDETAPSDSLLIASYPFVSTAADTLYDPADNLAPFYAKLRRLDSVRTVAAADTLSDSDDGLRKVNIIHFGDSHIQAGFITDVIMRHFHRRFGNAGRGMIVPYKLCGSNEPRDYAIQAVRGRCGEWSSSRVANARPSLPIGISGISVQSSTADNRILLCTFNSNSDTLDYRFNKVRVFHGQYAPIIEADENLSAGLSAPDIIYDFNTDIDLVATVDSLELHTYSDGKFAKGPIYGFSLENGHDGVLYHALGVNSACFLHWAKQDEVVRQSAALEPDLIVLSMGSNEAAGNNFNDEVFYHEIDRFVAPLREANPEAAILLTAPAQAFRKGAPNANFGPISRTLKRYAQDKGVAFIDVYAATGGDGSAAHWAENGLMARDKIHYTEEGYRIQGLLIYNALYNGYIGHGHTAQ